MKSLYFVVFLVLLTNSCLAVPWNTIILNGFDGIITMAKNKMEKDGSSSRNNKALNRLQDNVKSINTRRAELGIFGHLMIHTVIVF